jgi:hypothetical protein
MEGKEKFDNIHYFHSEVIISVSDLILFFNFIRVIDMFSSKKLRFRWLGPYRIHTVY